MDAKALAKSKRAHSQHHSKKSYAGHKQKAERSDGAKNPKKLQGNLTAAEKSKNPIQSERVPALPSNWDRYDEEFNQDLDDTSGSSSAPQHTDVILPKSKGADFRHLIAEAEAESRSKMDIISHDFPSLDDLLHDEFSKVVGSMLSARGESIRSWLEDDNFIVEDGSALTHEPTFLSLNLNALAEKLEKVDLHEALYIEADILPAELSQNQSQTMQETKHVMPVLHEPDDREPIVLDSPITTGQLEKPSNSVVDMKSTAFEDELDMLLNSYGSVSLQESCNEPNPLRNGVKISDPSDQKIHRASFDDDLDVLLEQTSDSVNKPRQEQEQEQEKSTSLSSVGKSKLLDEFDSWLDTI